jgi:hypothetical protein
LFDALRCLRRAEEELTIWVDAHCINQQDIVEKGHQIQMMGDIYNRVKEVIVWLAD